MRTLIAVVLGVLLGAGIAAGGYLWAMTVPTKMLWAEPGGEVFEHIDRYSRWRLEGNKVVIDGFCISACTLVLTLVPDVCATKWARFGFHSASTFGPMGRVHSKWATDLVWSMYPEGLKVELRKRGWDGGEHPGLLFLTRDEMGGSVRFC